VAQLEVDIVDADGKVWSGAARQVSAPAAEGEIGILPGHTPVLALLRAGEVRVIEHAGTPPLRWTVDGGFLSVDSDQVTIAVDAAQAARTH
jgi:F-type H+-transporting ATPase subunit epsilon